MLHHVRIPYRIRWSHNTGRQSVTHRILNSISRELGHFMRDDLLGHAIGRSGISHQLGMTSVIQTGEEKGCFVDGLAYRQQTVLISDLSLSS